MLTECTVSASPGPETNCTEFPTLNALSNIYGQMHAYLALAVCIFGVITNLLNVVVLTQKPLRSPTNTLLTCIALADCVTMLVYAIQTVRLNLLTSPQPDKYAHSWLDVHFTLVEHATFIGSHTVSTILLVQLAAFRCCVIYSASRETSDARRARRKSVLSHGPVALGIVLACVLGSVMALPTVLLYCITASQIQNPQLPNQTQTGYWFNTRVGYEQMEYSYFLLYSCLVKLLASILILVLSLCILSLMHSAHQRYLTLRDKLNKRGPSAVNPLSTRENEGVDEHPCCLAERLNDKRTTNPEDKVIANISVIDENSGRNKHPDGTTNNHVELVITAHQPNSSLTSKRGTREKMKNTQLARRNRQSQRVTTMLIIVMASFVMTEAPQGLLATLVAIKGSCFHDKIYIPLGQLLDLTVLLSSSINFILYCSMSQLFRAHFTRLVCTQWMRFCLPATVKMDHLLSDQRVQGPTSGLSTGINANKAFRYRTDTDY